WGALSILQSNNGKEFTSKVIKRVCEALEITVRHGCPQNLMSQEQPGQSVAIAPDTDMNPTIRKHKLQTTFKETGIVVSITNNNKTIVVKMPEGNT
ncbi:18333_t:CDS:2, partial [Racocetra persica]